MRTDRKQSLQIVYKITFGVVVILLTYGNAAMAQWAFSLSAGKGAPISTSGFKDYSISDGDSPPAFLAIKLLGKDFSFSPVTVGAGLKIAGKNYEENAVGICLPIYVEVGFGSGKLPLRGDIGVGLKFGKKLSLETIGAVGFQYLSIKSITSAVVTGAPPFVTNGSNVISGDQLNIINQKLYYKACANLRINLNKIVPFAQVGYMATFGTSGTQIKNNTTGEQINIDFLSDRPSVDIKGIYFQAGIELVF